MISLFRCFGWAQLSAWFLLVSMSYSHPVARAADDLLSIEQAAFSKAVAAAAPCVVQIETFGGLEKGDRQAIGEGPVTGTIVGEDGWIVSSLYSLRELPASILVTLPAGNRVPARIVARDYSREIALLKVETPEALPIAASAELRGLQVGQWCIAIGKTYDSRTVTQSVGIISALGRAYGRAVQTDAKVSPINYGGPLIDLEGKVIGILSPIAAAEMLEDDASMLYDSGIGFAIPLEDILKRLPKMQSGKDIRAGKLGIVSKTQNELAGPVRLTGAAPGTPAAKAGAKPGDILVEAQGIPVELLADLRAALAQVDAGDKFSFKVKRGTEQFELSCELTAEVPVYRRRYLGLKLQAVDLGLRVVSVDANSPAEKAGLKPDQILTQGNDKPLKQKADLVAVTAVAELDSTIKLSVLDQPAASSRNVLLQPSVWPTALIEHPLEKISYLDAEGKEDTNAKASVTQLKLADIPNVIHAIVPPQPNRPQLGCLVLFPEPGAVEPDKLKSQWEEFSKAYGWLVVVPTSANPKNWSRDEATELPARLIARLAQEYDLDGLRTVAAGVGIGGQLALRTAMTNGNQFSAVLAINTPLRPFSMPRPNMPLQTIDFLLVGAKMEPVAEQLNALGFVANSLNPPGLDLAKWNTVPMEAIIKWLESLGHI
jgi:serine protease Do